MADRSDSEARSAKLRQVYATLVAGPASVADPRIEAAFAAIPREAFAGPAPWTILTPASRRFRQHGPVYVRTPDDDPAFLYQDVLIALDAERGIHIGQPSLHALCLDALSPQPGETAIQVGTGSGYYTALLAHLIGPTGQVHAFEIDPALAARATANLTPWPWVRICARSGVADPLPAADAIYVNAGAARPARAWLDVLQPGGRLLFPLQSAQGRGGMLLLQRPSSGSAWPARFVSYAIFIPLRDMPPEDGSGLTAAFARGDLRAVRSFRLAAPPDASCWYDGGDWWLSTREP